MLENSAHSCYGATLALLCAWCATAQQNYCRHAGVHRPSSVPSVKPVLGKRQLTLTPPSVERYLFTIISSLFIYLFIYLFIIFDSFPFSLIWHHIGGKFSNGIFSGRFRTDSLTKKSQIAKFHILDFCQLFFLRFR